MGVVAPQGRVGPPGRRAVHCAAMEYRNLGRSGVQVSSVSLGSWLTFGSRIEVAEAGLCVVVLEAGERLEAPDFSGVEGERFFHLGRFATTVRIADAMTYDVER